LDNTSSPAAVQNLPLHHQRVEPISLFADHFAAHLVRCRLAGLPDCIISAVLAVFFLAVGASMASYGTCAAGGGMTGSMSRSMALMFGGSLTGSTTTISSTDVASATAAMNDMLNQLNHLTADIPMRRLHYTLKSNSVVRLATATVETSSDYC
jgi:hypothetical protein